MQQLEFNPDNSLLCSCDISSLFTNVPLAETIQIRADTLYNGQLPSPQFSKEIFIELMNVETKSVEFSCDNVMYKQTGGMALGSPLGPALANIFVGYHKNKHVTSVEKPLLYTRYVDDTFAIFRSKAQADKFFTALNSLHSDLKFTMEKEANQTLRFLNVKIEKRKSPIFNLHLQKILIYRSIYSLRFIWTIRTQNPPKWNSSTPSTGYLFQKQTSIRTGFYTIHLVAKWFSRSDDQF